MRALRNFKSNRCYHLISRIANRAFFLTEEERSRFVARMWRVAEFSGIGVLAYCFMGNHFHLLVYLPEARKLDDGELFDRIASLYQGVRLSEIRQEWDMCVRTGDEPGKQSFRERFFRRMYDVSAFMKTLKQNSTMSYNSHIVPWEQIREMHEKSIRPCHTTAAASTRGTRERGNATPTSSPGSRFARCTRSRFILSSGNSRTRNSPDLRGRGFPSTRRSPRKCGGRRLSASRSRFPSVCRVFWRKAATKSPSICSSSLPMDRGDRLSCVRR